MKKKVLDFSAETEKEKIRRWSRISPENKLIWLKEFNEFIYAFLSPEQKRLRLKYRIG